MDGQCYHPGKETSLKHSQVPKDKNYCLKLLSQSTQSNRKQDCRGFTLLADRKMLFQGNLTLTWKLAYFLLASLLRPMSHNLFHCTRVLWSPSHFCNLAPLCCHVPTVLMFVSCISPVISPFSCICHEALHSLRRSCQPSLHTNENQHFIFHSY